MKEEKIKVEFEKMQSFSTTQINLGMNVWRKIIEKCGKGYHKIKVVMIVDKKEIEMPKVGYNFKIEAVE